LNPVARKSHSVEEVDLDGNVSIGFGLVYWLGFFKLGLCYPFSKKQMAVGPGEFVD
jgi:hypothetical protein